MPISCWKNIDAQEGIIFESRQGCGKKMVVLIILLPKRKYGRINIHVGASSGQAIKVMAKIFSSGCFFTWKQVWPITLSKRILMLLYSQDDMGKLLETENHIKALMNSNSHLTLFAIVKFPIKLTRS
jgi:hypothetical protein